eukprot:scaffold8476_cov39-Tisochrysis_lutea.AAC.1
MPSPPPARRRGHTASASARAWTSAPAPRSAGLRASLPASYHPVHSTPRHCARAAPRRARGRQEAAERQARRPRRGGRCPRGDREWRSAWSSRSVGIWLSAGGESR